VSDGAAPYEEREKCEHGAHQREDIEEEEPSSDEQRAQGELGARGRDRRSGRSLREPKVAAGDVVPRR
jgi:hypothetical protein